MLRDDVSWTAHQYHPLLRESLRSFVSFVESRLGASFRADTDTFSFGKPEFAAEFAIAEALRRSGALTDLRLIPRAFNDEPRMYSWQATCGGTADYTANGLSMHDERDALIRAIAEALERTVWFESLDYFVDATATTQSELARTRRPFLALESFVSFTDESMRPTSETRVHWIRGHSWVNEKPVHIPTQVVSGAYGKYFHQVQEHGVEPMVRPRITTGMAVGRTFDDVLLAGVLEVIERDALMITWLNRLSAPRIDLRALAQNDAGYARMLDTCARYRLSIDVIQLVTDAPAHAVCVVLKDMTDKYPQITIGTKAHSHLLRAVEGALYEALRTRVTLRHHLNDKETSDAGPRGHSYKRVRYWNIAGREKQLEWLTAGAIVPAPPDYSAGTHFAQIVEWCKKSGYQCASVDMSKTALNTSPWRVGCVVIPELVPLTMRDAFHAPTSTRPHAVAQKMGYATSAYNTEPHPFL